MAYISCSICGNRYEPSVYDWVCPKCGAFNQSGTSDKNVTPLWETEEPTAQKPQKERDRRKTLSAQTRGAGRLRPKLLLCIAGAVLLTIGGAAAGRLYLKLQREAVLKTPIPVTQAEQGEVVRLPDGFTLSLKAAFVVPQYEDTMYFPDGTKPFAVPFSCIYQPPDAASENTINDYSYYAKLEDGTCVLNENFYRLSDIFPALSLSQNMPGEAVYDSLSEGQFVFFLPADTRRFTLCAEQIDNGLVVRRFEYPVTTQEVQI